MDPVRLFVSVSLLLCAAEVALTAAPAPGPNPAAASASPRPPVPPVGTTPIDFFRQLLAADAGTRATLLAGKSAQHREILENSLRSYAKLHPEQRESRLRTMELRYRLTSLLRLPPSNRVERLRLMPEQDRPLLEERLRIWDGMARAEQELLLLSHAPTALVNEHPAPRSDLPISLQTSNKLRRIEEQLVRWQSLPTNRRVIVQQTFTNLFGVAEIERLRPLPLKDEELKTMEESLKQFAQLAPAQREQCLRNFQHFAELSPLERRQFLLSAQQWQNMEPSVRAAWRRLVSRMPPLPPRMFYPPIPKSTRVVATTN